jgi:CSLREA domain-containing protein
MNILLITELSVVLDCACKVTQREVEMNIFSNRLFDHKGRGLRKPVILGVILTLLLLLAGKPQSVYAASITVTTIDDELNADGDCSLREAIQAANTDTAVDACPAGSGADTIMVPAGTYLLSISVFEDAPEYDNQQGDLDIGSDVIIEGDGAATTIIDGASLDRQTGGARVLQIITGQVYVSGVTIRNGFDDGGGGIANNGALTLTNSTIADNSAGIGGGIANSGTLAIFDSTISSNSSTGWGGGIHNGGTLTITGSMIADNHATQFGGAIRNDGTLTISSSTIAGNRAEDGGGGIANLGILTLTNSTVSSNSALLHAGGIQNMDDLGGGELTITGSSFTGNIASDGGAILNEASSNITIHNSTFEDNRADSIGAGIANWGGVAIYDSKIKNNSATFRGGGIHNDSLGTLTISDSKIVNNSAGSGGGIFNDGGMVTLTDTKVRNNQPDNCVGC